MHIHIRAHRLALAVTLGALAVSGCNQLGSPADAEGAQSEKAAPADPSFDAAMAAHNFGQAVQMAALAQAAHPEDPATHLQRAQAEAAKGDAKASATAFLQALAAELPDAKAALAEPVFDSVRNSQPFRAVKAAMAPETPAKTAPAASTVRQRAPETRIRAGNVEIVEGPNGGVVRAGDVVLRDSH